MDAGPQRSLSCRSLLRRWKRHTKLACLQESKGKSAGKFEELLEVAPGLDQKVCGEGAYQTLSRESLHHGGTWKTCCAKDTSVKILCLRASEYTCAYPSHWDAHIRAFHRSPQRPQLQP